MSTLLRMLVFSVSLKARSAKDSVSGVRLVVRSVDISYNRTSVWLGSPASVTRRPKASRRSTSVEPFRLLLENQGIVHGVAFCCVPGNGKNCMYHGLSIVFSGAVDEIMSRSS